jgi:hypothetical protein
MRWNASVDHQVHIWCDAPSSEFAHLRMRLQTSRPPPTPVHRRWLQGQCAATRGEDAAATDLVASQHEGAAGESSVGPGPSRNNAARSSTLGTRTQGNSALASAVHCREAPRGRFRLPARPRNGGTARPIGERRAIRAGTAHPPQPPRGAATGQRVGRRRGRVRFEPGACERAAPLCVQAEAADYPLEHSLCCRRRAARSGGL